MERIATAVALLVLCNALLAQVPYPPNCIQNVDWASGAHQSTVTQPIEAPCSSASQVTISGTAEVEFTSGTSVHLTNGFHAGGFSGTGSFRARIDEGLGAPADLVLIAPDPGTHIQDNLVHVEKWEKLEVGLRLPQVYLAAVDSFFTHYYSNSTNNTATPGHVDAAHDLNPYADDSLQVVMTVTSPTGAHRMQWGFYMREAHWRSDDPLARLTADTANPLDRYRIRFRFAPDEEGLWLYSLAVRAPHTRTLADVPLPSLAHSGYAFQCDPPLEDNHGFLHVNTTNRRLLQFDDGTAFLGMGTNMCGIRHRWILDDLPPGTWGAWYRYYLRDRKIMMQTMRQLHAVGGNYLRLALTWDQSAMEWVNAGVYDSFYNDLPCNDDSNGGILDTGNCQYTAWDLDRTLDSARADQLYLQICVEPNCPGRGGETTGWGNHPYVRSFLYPYRDPGTGVLDTKRFFFTPDTNGDPQYNAGVFYYWKRKYKYMLSRWGYSVNIAALEPFNEVDLLLGRDSVTIGSTSDCCPESYGFWPKDTALPATMDHWYSKLAQYVRGVQVPENPAASPLGENRKLFLVSYADPDHWTDSSLYYRHFTNPDIDLIDAHMYLYQDTSKENLPDWGMRWNFDKTQRLRNTVTGTPPEARKPINAGEGNYWSHMEFGSWNEQIEKVFHNYDVSFHNELWAGAFSGKFATGMTWLWERVFWWEGSLTPPPPDPSSLVYLQHQFPGGYSNALGDTNYVDIGGLAVPIVNRNLFHQFKPLADMLSNPALQDYDFFNWSFAPHKIHDTANGVESYYLVNESGTMAIGWVHNLSAWTMNNYYLSSGLQNFLGCTSPTTDTVSLPGFAQDHDLYITYFPTPMNASVPPNDPITSTSTGRALLDLSDDPLNGIANNYLDTLHSDYAFIIAPYPVSRSMFVPNVVDLSSAVLDWDFSIYPNPASDELFVRLPDSTPKDIVLYDLTGRRVHSWSSMSGPIRLRLIGNLAKGAYCVQVSDATTTKVKRLIIQ